MKRSLILAAACCLIVVLTAGAGERPLKRDNRSLARGPAAPAAAQAPASPAERPAPATSVPGSAPRRVVVVTAPRARDVLGVRPVGWRARHALGYAYPPLMIGQYDQPPIDSRSATAPAPQGPPMYDPQTTVNAPAATLGPAPGYKYGYAGRYPGAYAWSSAYNSGYYTAGCYGVNACCRASRRYCTPFGGMFRGCGPGCYVAQVPPCPTNCQMGPVINAAAPPAYGTPTPVPSTAPQVPTPATPPSPAPPQPVEKKVTPAPQASVSPKLPSLPPDA